MVRRGILRQREVKGEGCRQVCKIVGIAQQGIRFVVGYGQDAWGYEQVHQDFWKSHEPSCIGAQSHAQVGRIGLEDRVYAFAARLSSLRGHVLLDNQSSVHVFCDPNKVSNTRKASRELSLESNGGKLPISDILPMRDLGSWCGSRRRP